MFITPIESQEVWDNFIEGVRPNTFLHSWQWGEFQRAMGERVWRLGVFDTTALQQDNMTAMQHGSAATLVGVALIIKVRAKRGAFLFCPHGPILIAHNSPSSILILSADGQPPLTLRGGAVALIDYLKPLAHAERCSFIRFSPLMLKTPEHEKTWNKLGFREAPIHMHPELAWILDITPPTDQLLAQMRKTTRYSIRKAEKDGVKVIQNTDPNDIDKFWSVYSATVDRQHFVPFSKQYLRAEFEVLAKQGSAALFFGTYRGEIVSTAFIVFQGWSAFYHHGASNLKYTNIPASQLVQWHAILEAKRRGCIRYNFWGIAPENNPTHPWVGLSLFKKGFGGYAEEYVHAKDLVVSPAYWINFTVERLRRIKRHL